MFKPIRLQSITLTVLPEDMVEAKANANFRWTRGFRDTSSARLYGSNKIVQYVDLPMFASNEPVVRFEFVEGATVKEAIRYTEQWLSQPIDGLARVLATSAGLHPPRDEDDHYGALFDNHTTLALLLFDKNTGVLRLIHDVPL